MSLDAVKFDVIRVWYRKERRKLIGEIILHRYVGQPMKAYIDSYIERVIPEKDQKAFLKNVMEDLEYMDPCRIVGLGVTEIELEEWMKKYRSQI
jgi:hypothetical protein